MSKKNYVWFPIIAHEKQWALVVISQWTSVPDSCWYFLVDSGWLLAKSGDVWTAQGAHRHRYVLQHCCDFHSKPIITNQIIRHAHQVAKAMTNVYLHKSLKTPNKLRTKISYRI